MEARRSSSGNLTKSTSPSSRRNDRLVVLLLRETVLLHQQCAQAHIAERAPLPLGAGIERLVMTVEEETEVIIRSRTGTEMVIEGRIWIGVASGGGIEMMTGIDEGNGTKTNGEVETGMVMDTIAIQTNGIAQGIDARGTVAREIEHPCVKQGKYSLLLHRMYLCTFVTYDILGRNADCECRCLPFVLPWTECLGGFFTSTILVTIKDFTSWPKRMALEA